LPAYPNTPETMRGKPVRIYTRIFWRFYSFIEIVNVKRRGNIQTGNGFSYIKSKSDLVALKQVYPRWDFVPNNTFLKISELI